MSDLATSFDMPHMDVHLVQELRVDDPDTLERAVLALLRARTCFAVVGGEGRIRVTARGAHVLRDLLEGADGE